MSRKNCEGCNEKKVITIPNVDTEVRYEVRAMNAKMIVILTLIALTAAVVIGAGIWTYQTVSVLAWQLQRNPLTGPVITTVLSLATVGLGAWLFILVKDALHSRRIERARNELSTVQFYSDQFQTWAVNPLGLSMNNLSHEWRLLIDNTPEVDPGQWQIIRTIEHIRNKQPHRINVKNDLMEGLLPAPGMQPVLPHIIGSQRLLIAGGQESGKTNLLRWIAFEKQRLSKVLVIDTHNGPGYWPIDEHAVLGTNRNWGAVEQALIRLLDVMDKRYQDIGTGKVGIRGHEIITVIADEWTMIPEAIGEKTIKKYTKPVLSESRKAGIDFILAAHDTTVEALGIKGMGGLIKAFDYLVETENRDGQFICKVRKPSQKPSEAVIYAAPPLFQGQPSPPRQLAPGPVADVIEAEPAMSFHVAPEPVEVGPSEEEQAIIFHYVDLRDNDRGNFSYNEVARRALGSAGGRQVSQIKETLEKFGIEAI